MPARHSVPTALALFAAALLLWPSDGAAGNRYKSIKTEAEWVGYDRVAETVTVRVRDPGSGKAARGLKRGAPVAFRVTPTGPVFKRTTVSIHGMKAELDDIPAGKTVNVYWRPDEDDDEVRVARKIDMIMSPEEWARRYVVDESR